MQNPTIVVLTDRNDLDDQLFGQFQRCADILGQTPVQAASRVYDIQRAVADKATVPIYYESRIAKLSLNASEMPKLDAEFEEIIPQSRDEEEFRQKMLAKWAALEALVGDPKRMSRRI